MEHCTQHCQAKNEGNCFDVAAKAWTLSWIGLEPLVSAIWNLEHETLTLTMRETLDYLQR